MDSTTPTKNLSQNRQAELRAIMIFISCLATLFVSLRFYARSLRGIRYAWDDWMILFALPWLCLLMVLGLLMVHFGLGTHQAGLEVSQLVNFGKTLLAFECVYIFTAAIIKTSLLLMYRRAFDIRRIQIASIILEAIVIAWATAIILLCIFQCTPISKAWNPTLHGTCINLRASFIGNALPNIITDVAILALPIHALWSLDTSLGLRLQLSFVFSLGFFVVFTAIYRFTTLFAFDHTDTTWTLATSCAWVVVEVASGIISVCLPTLGPLLQCGDWRARARAVRESNGIQSGSVVSKGSVVTKKSLPTKVYAMGHVETSNETGDLQRLNSKTSTKEDFTQRELQMVGAGPTETMELGIQSANGYRSDSERESDGELIENEGLAPQPKNSMLKELN